MLSKPTEYEQSSRRPNQSQLEEDLRYIIRDPAGNLIRDQIQTPVKTPKKTPIKKPIQILIKRAVKVLIKRRKLWIISAEDL
jgi:hypothetical protein